MLNEKELIEEAVKARERAYAPYSGFPVGAALLAVDGRVFTGSNVENASYGLTMCAERVALFKAVSEGAREFTAIAISCGEGACAPCGACRQVLSEFAPDLLVIMTDGEGKKVRRGTLSALLPLSFGPKELRGP
jgi:cytidine deaminase